MKSFITNATLFVTGGFAGFLISKKIYEKKYADLAQEEIDSVKEKFKEKENKLGKPSENVTEQSKSDDVYFEEKAKDTQYKKYRETLTNNNPLTRSSLDENPYEQAKKNYSFVSKKTTEAEFEAEYGDLDAEPLDDAGMSERDMRGDYTLEHTDKPYLIYLTDFTDSNNIFDKVTLYYYREDNVLCEENEDIISDVEAVVGYEAIDLLEEEVSVYVRNEKISTDYEIIGVNKSYSETVYGVQTETPREKYERKLRERGEDV